MMSSVRVPNSAERLRWFNEARFGMFIHWGIYSILARGEWVRLVERIPPEEYEPLAQQFNPTRYDPREWVAVAKQAGMKYMVLTTRHHDGFSLFDSQVSEFTAAKTAAKRDLVDGFVKACRAEGMRVGFYFSLLDWRYPTYFTGPEKEPKSWAKFLDYVHTQVRELCTRYGKLDVMWYDGAWPWTPEAWQSAKLNAMVRELQPEVVINNRSLLPEDYDTPEQHVAASQPGRAWESCMTMNDNWGYSAGDHNWKTVRQLIHNLVRCAAGGGNYLLNVGPRPDGSIPMPSLTRLRQIGEWMKVNGESIYGSERCPFGGGMIGLTTAKGNTAYLHVFRWPGREACIAGIKNKVVSARVLTTDQSVEVERRGDRTLFRGLPRYPPDPYDSVIVLELDGRPEAI